MGTRAGGDGRRRFPGTTRSSTRSSPTTVACGRSSRARATASSPRLPARPMPSPRRSMPSERSWPRPGLPGAELHVRMAIHTGEAQLRDEGNYFGQTVIRCARLRAIGHGDQILVSDAAAGLVVDQLPDGVHLADLGHAPAEGPRSSRARVAGGPSRSSGRAGPAALARRAPSQPPGAAHATHRAGARCRRDRPARRSRSGSSR